MPWQMILRELKNEEPLQTEAILIGSGATEICFPIILVSTFHCESASPPEAQNDDGIDLIFSYLYYIFLCVVVVFCSVFVWFL